jgi:Txe/YoeB family toxin of Txe-Axe toxin-antitoxin module
VATTLAADVQLAVMDEIARQVQAARADLEAQLLQVQSESDELADENNRLFVEIEEQKVSVEALKEALAVSAGKSVAMAAQFEQQEIAYQTLSKQVETLKLDAATATGKAEGLSVQLSEMWARIDQEQERTTKALKC